MTLPFSIWNTSPSQNPSDSILLVFTSCTVFHRYNLIFRYSYLPLLSFQSPLAQRSCYSRPLKCLPIRFVCLSTCQYTLLYCYIRTCSHVHTPTSLSFYPSIHPLVFPSVSSLSPYSALHSLTFAISNRNKLILIDSTINSSSRPSVPRDDAPPVALLTARLTLRSLLYESLFGYTTTSVSLRVAQTKPTGTWTRL